MSEADLHPGAAEGRITTFVRRLRTLPLSLLVGSTIVVLTLFVAAFGNLIAPFPYDEMHYSDIHVAPNATYLFGTDQYGRDVLSRVLVGAKISLAYGLGCSLISLAIGVPIGLWAGYKGGRTDELLMRGLDVLMAIPPIMLGLLVLAMTTPALWKTILAIGIVSAPAAARIVRSITLELRSRAFVRIARARGERDAYIVFNEILLNAWPIILVEAGLRVTFGILLGAGLSFLGLGAQPPSSDWGLMMAEGRAYVTTAPWSVLFPGMAMFVVCIGFNLFGDGLRDALDPTASGR